MPRIMSLKNFVSSLALFCLSAFSSPSFAQLLKLPGQFNVGTSGAATYSIPIQVPPGTAGMQPSISLNYSSQGSNDIMGLGWSIGGLPSVQWCAPTRAQDGFDGYTNYGDGGRFCMGGQRLVSTDETDYWQTYYGDFLSGEYRTEIDNYTKIIAGPIDPPILWGPGTFSAQTKSGLTLEFGHTEDSKLEGSNSIRAWYVNEVGDLAGNKYEVSYGGGNDGYIYPTRIDYTITGYPTNVDAYNSIRFEYDFNRPDPIRTYQDGEETVVNALLTNIKTYEGENLIHDYQITYEAGASEVRPSRVSAITLCDGTSPTPQCLPATTFTWPAANDPVTHLTPVDHSSSGIDPGIATNDYNGDGLPDFLREIDTAGQDEAKYWMSTGPAQWVAQSEDVPTSQSSYATLIPYPAELDGDGYTDMVIDKYGPVRLVNLINDGTGKQEYGTSGNGGANSAAIPFGDLNGDGRDDLLYLGNEDGIGYYSNGDGTYNEGGQPGEEDQFVGLDSTATVFAGDFNGDGCMDILADDYSSLEKVYFTCSASVDTVSVQLSGDFVLGDFNGDGKTDILDVDNSTDELRLSTGEGFDSFDLTGISDWDKYQIHAGDFNGDGKSDVALIAASTSGGNYGPPTTHKVYLSTGTGFESSPSMTIANPSGSVTQANVHDFNGDDVADIWIKKSSSNYLYITDFEPQFISQIDDGLGQSISITYDRLNDNSTSADIYTKGTGAVYPTLDVIGGQYVVSEYDLPNGIGGTNTYSYEYEGLKYNQHGRGMLGFNKVIVTDPNNIVTTTTYKQDYPYIGLVDQQTIVSGSVTLSSVTNTYSNTSHSGKGGDRRQVFLDSKVEVYNDLNGASLPGVTTSYNYDSYGNTTWINVERAGGKGTPGGDETTTTMSYWNNANTWVIGRPDITTIKYYMYNSPTITRKIDIDTDSNTALVTREVVEPNNTALKLTTDYTRDDFGNILTITQSGVDITTQTTTNVYDSKGRFVTQTTNAEGHVEQFQNDPRFGGITSYTDPNSLVSTFQYDNFGRLTKETTPDGRSRNTSYNYCSGVAGGSTTCPTNGAMEILKVPKRSDGTTQSGPAVKQVIDKLGRELLAGNEAFNGTDWSISETFYDSLGRVQKTTSPYFDSGSATQHTTFSYDTLARVTSSLTYPDSSTTTYTYNGLTTTVNNGLNQDKTTVLNNQGLVATVTEEGDTTGSGDDITTTYDYNAAGELIEVTDPAGNELTNLVDVRGRVYRTWDPSIGYIYYEYTVLNQPKQKTSSGKDTYFYYDKLGRLTSLVEDNLTSTFVYDTATNGTGRLKEMSTSDGNKRIHYYDSLGRPSQTRLTIDSGNYDYLYSYNSDGRLNTVEYPSGYEVRYEYTGTQRYLQYLKEDSSGNTLWTANSRNAAGQFTQATMNLSNSYTVDRTYDAYGRITDVEAGTSNAIADLTFTYDKLGNLTQRQDLNQSVTETFAFDAMNRMIGATIGSTTKSVTYNDVGNITSKTRLGSSNTNTYTYPTPGSFMPYSVSSISGVVNGVTNPTFTYDNDGNLTSGAGRTASWTAFNKVASITEGSLTVSYIYDAEHQRIKQSDGTTTTRFLNDPVSGVQSEYLTSDGGTYNDYLFADGERVGVRTEKTSPSSTTLQGFVHDHERSISVVTDSSGSVVQNLAYDVWGRRRNPNGTEDPTGAITAPTTRGYTDHQHLPGGVNGIHVINMNARIYDPEVGRFMSADPTIPDMFSSQSLNRTTYVRNNPGSKIDPTGFRDCSANGCITTNELDEFIRTYEFDTEGEAAGTDFIELGGSYTASSGSDKSGSNRSQLNEDRQASIPITGSAGDIPFVGPINESTILANVSGGSYDEFDRIAFLTAHFVGLGLIAFDIANTAVGAIGPDAGIIGAGIISGAWARTALSRVADDVIASALRPSRLGSQDSRALSSLKKKVDRLDNAYSGVPKTHDAAVDIIRQTLNAKDPLITKYIKNGKKVRDVFDPSTGRGIRIRDNQFDTFLNLDTF